MVHQSSGVALAESIGGSGSTKVMGSSSPPELATIQSRYGPSAPATGAFPSGVRTIPMVPPVCSTNTLAPMTGGPLAAGRFCGVPLDSLRVRLQRPPLHLLGSTHRILDPRLHVRHADDDQAGLAGV